MTVNQKYKHSGSSLSFKDWLESEKKRGGFKKYMNADGGMELSFGDIKVKYIGIAVLVLVVGGIIYSRFKKNK